MKRIYITISLLCSAIMSFAQLFEGTISEMGSGLPLEGVSVKIIEDDIEVVTNFEGQFSITASNTELKTLGVELDGYMYEEIPGLSQNSDIELSLREKKKSMATTRWDDYMSSCISYNSPSIPHDELWELEFEETNLSGDLTANSYYTRRDPSAVIEVNGKYYVWYTYCISASSTYFSTNNPADKVFPWDYCDVYYATSTDGYSWQEQGPAVTRGTAGSFDDRSVFTPEIFVHEDKYYLVYQVVQDPYIERVKNNVAMAVADSPDGPWRKLDEPILRPTNNGIWSEGSTSRLDADKKGDFDSHKVHDPCLVYYKDKFYLYYKGERMGEEQYCGQREIKWGVAIADHPEGPYVKSEYNPITNTGHEVSIWPHENGIAIIQKLDGPERGTIQFAEDGINFEIMGAASDIPDALGIFRGQGLEGHPHAGVQWGLCHVLRWDVIPGGWMYLKRFDIINTSVTGINIVSDTLYLQENSFETIGVQLYPSFASNNNLNWTSDDNNIATVNQNGVANGLNNGLAKVKVTTEDGNHSDSVIIVVAGDSLISQTIEAEDFIGTGGTYTDSYVGEGVNRNGDIGINWVNTADWAEYNLNIQEPGIYKVVYNICSPVDNSEITGMIDDEVFSVDDVPDNGTGDQWDLYEKLAATSNVTLDKGEYIFKVLANGSNIWQWNLESIDFIKISDLPDIPVSGITISPLYDSILIGRTIQLVEEVIPANASNKKVLWSSNSPAAIVNDSGYVTAQDTGMVLITAITEDGGYSANCELQITPIIADSIRIEQTDYNMIIGDTASFTINIYPENSTDKRIIWRSGNEAIVTVSGSGRILAKSVGNTKIYASSFSGLLHDSVYISVLSDYTSLRVEPELGTIEKGDSIQLIAISEPFGASLRVDWSVSDSSIAVINNEGLLVGISKGEVIAKAKLENRDMYATSTINVIPVSVKGVRVMPAYAEISIYDTIQLEAAVEPQDAQNRMVVWRSENSDIATIDSTGIAIALDTGSVKIITTTVEGDYSAFCELRLVPAEPDSIVITSETKEVDIYDTLQLGVRYYPEKSVKKNISWISSNNNIASVGSNGKVFTTDTGLVIITAISEGAEYTYSTQIKVRPVYADFIRVTPIDKELKVEDSHQLSLSFYPENVTYKEVSWSTNNELVASIDEKGVLTCNDTGVVIVKVKSKVNNVEDSISVYIGAISITGIEIIAPVTSLEVGKGGMLGVDIIPDNATNKDVIWTSDNEGIISIDSIGTIMAIKKGFTFIKVMSVDGGYTDSIRINVEDPSKMIPVLREQVAFYPNPVYDELVITGLTGNEYLLKIYNVRGEMVLSKRIQNYGSNPVGLQLNILPEGNYIMQVTGNNNEKTFLFSKALK